MRTQIDSLNPSAREFYERSRLKLVLSLMLAAFGMMFLAMVAGSGASASAAYKIATLSGAINGVTFELTGDAKESIEALRSGYGFQCFVALVAFFLSVLGALYFSPLYQTPNDKIAIKDPMLLAQLYPDSSNDPNKVN